MMAAQRVPDGRPARRAGGEESSGVKYMHYLVGHSSALAIVKCGLASSRNSCCVLRLSKRLEFHQRYLRNITVVAMLGGPRWIMGCVVKK